MKPGKPGTPRYQRYLNMRFLADLQAQLSDAEDTDEEDEILANDYIEQEESFFADLFDPSNTSAKKLFEPFLCIDIDEYDKQMQELSSSIPMSSSSPPSNMPKQHGVPTRYAEPLQRCAKNASYYMLLCSIEAHVVHYIDIIREGLCSQNAENYDWNSVLSKTRVFAELESENRLGAHLARDDERNFPHLSLLLSDSYQRLLCHAVCAYYMLNSESENVDGKRVTCVRLRQTPKTVAALGGGWKPSKPKLSLAQYVVQ